MTLYAILIGQAPARSSRGESRPLEGRSGDRLARLIGMDDYEQLTEVFAVANLLGRWPGGSGKGDGFPLPEARAAALGFHRLLGEEEWERIVLLGRPVAAAFGLVDAPFLRWLAPTTGEPSPRGVRERRRAWYEVGSWLVPEHIQEFVWPDARWAVVPHPSGVSHWWNDPANVADAQKFLRELAA